MRHASPHSSQIEKLPPDLLNMAFLSKHSQRGTLRATQSSWSLLNEEGPQCVALGINMSQWSTLVPKAQIYQATPVSKVSDKKEKSKHFPSPLRCSTTHQKHPFPACFCYPPSFIHHTHTLTTFLALSQTRTVPTL